MTSKIKYLCLPVLLPFALCYTFYIGYKAIMEDSMIEGERNVKP